MAEWTIILLAAPVAVLAASGVALARRGKRVHGASEFCLSMVVVSVVAIGGPAVRSAACVLVVFAYSGFALKSMRDVHSARPGLCGCGLVEVPISKLVTVRAGAMLLSALLALLLSVFSASTTESWIPPFLAGSGLGVALFGMLSAFGLLDVEKSWQERVHGFAP